MNILKAYSNEVAHTAQNKHALVEQLSPQTTYCYTGFLVDWANPYMSFGWGSKHKPPFGDCAIYSETTVCDLLVL